MAEREPWKQALADYVNALNEACVREDPRPLEAVRDREHRRRLVRRLEASARRNRTEGIAPERSELRARIVRQAAGDRAALAEVELHHLRSWKQREQPWLEERVERERLRFVRMGRVWRLDRVEPLFAETEAVWLETGAEEEAEGGA